MSIHTFGPATLGRDAEIRYLNDGTAVANLSLAFSYGRKGENGKRPTTWVEGALWGKLAEALAQYLLKGTKVSVVMEELRIESFQKSDGTPASKLVAKVTAIDLISSQQQGQQSQAPAPASRLAPPRQQKPTPALPLDEFDNDIPF